MSETPSTSSGIIRDKKWLHTELEFAETLYDKIINDAAVDADELDLPQPYEFFEDPLTYKELWETYKNTLLVSFQCTHQKSLEQERKQKLRKLDELSLTDEEKLAKYLEELENPDPDAGHIPPPEFELDRESLRKFFASEICSYIALLVKLDEIIEKDFPDLVLQVEEIEVEPAPGETMLSQPRIKII